MKKKIEKIEKVSVRRTKTTFKQFKKFLAEECYSEEDYGAGKYDRKIWLWFFYNLY
jgi:hypothetical protein